MAIDLSGQGYFPKAGFVTIEVKNTHPLILLASILPWSELMELVTTDLKKTTKKGFWWTGRKIKVRIHIGAYLLQLLYNITDRKVEYQLNDNAAFQLFCGLDLRAGYCQRLACARSHKNREISQPAITGDSTDTCQFNSQNRCQPWLCRSERGGFRFYRANSEYFLPFGCEIDDQIGWDGKKGHRFYTRQADPAALYCFYSRYENDQEKSQILLFPCKKHRNRGKARSVQKLAHTGKTADKTSSRIMQIPYNKPNQPITLECQTSLQSNQKRSLALSTRCCSLYQEAYDQSWKSPFLSRQRVGMCQKRQGRPTFRVRTRIQLGRIKGNFLFALNSISVGMNDKQSFIPLLKEHARLFGDEMLETVASDKGYWSTENRKELEKLGKATEGLQKPSSIKKTSTDLALQERLRNRRAGIEPLIGHAKQGGQLYA